MAQATIIEGVKSEPTFAPAAYIYAGLSCLVLSAAFLIVLAARNASGDLWHFGEESGALLLAAAAGIVSLLWPVLDQSSPAAEMAPLVAFVGCDGSGKSTLAADLVTEFGKRCSVQSCYLGLGSGAIGARIKALPLVGPAFERRLAVKAKKTRTSGEKIPGLATAIVVYAFSLARLRRFRRMLKLRRAGVFVITDRYPQTEIVGFYDGPGLSAASTGSWLIGLLARQERQIYRWMASFEPSLVIRLNIDAKTAYLRKPDHGYDLLVRKVSATPMLRFNGARIVDLDSRQPYDTVRCAAVTMVDGALVSLART